MKEKWSYDTLIINEDPNWYTGIDVTSASSAYNSVRNYFLKYSGHAVTDVLAAILEQTSIVPSEYIMWRGEKYSQTVENGHCVDYKKRIEPLWKIYHEYSLDPVDIFIETMRECNIRPWITLRMNDTHFGSDETSFLRPDFYYEAQSKGYMIGEEYGYFAHCLDYSHSAVRERMQNYIKEVVSRYDADGIELDFMREIYCFDYRHNQECRHIMNDFMREVRNTVRAAEKAKGHSILVMARVPRSPDDSMEFGFDVETWAKEKLVDAVVPSPRWQISDSCIPADRWKKITGNDIAVFPAVETLGLGYSETTFENVKAYAAGWYSMGADGLYAYNMMPSTERNFKVWQLNRKKCFAGTRSFTVTYQDISSGSYPVYKPLPMDISVSNTISLTVGEIRANDKLTLTIDYEGSDSIPFVTLNGKSPLSSNKRGALKAAPVDSSKPDAVLTPHQAVEYIFPDSGNNNRSSNTVCIAFSGNGIIHYLDLKIASQED